MRCSESCAAGVQEPVDGDGVTSSFWQPAKMRPTANTDKPNENKNLSIARALGLFVQRSSFWLQSTDLRFLCSVYLLM